LEKEKITKSLLDRRRPTPAPVAALTEYHVARTDNTYWA